VGTVAASNGIYFPLASGSSQLLDVALASDGKLYGVSRAEVPGNSLRIINPGASKDSQIDPATFILKNAQGTVLLGNINALEFAANTLYAIENTDLAGDKLYKIDVTTKVATLVGDLPNGFASSGDLVYDAANSRFLATSRDTSSSDSLWQIPINNPLGSTKIGLIGFTNVSGIDFVNGQLTGFSSTATSFSSTGSQIDINVTTGQGTLNKTLGIGSITGASSIPFSTTVIPVIPITPIPITPTSTAIGTKSQGLAEGRTIDLTDYTNKILKVDINTSGDAAYTNNIGFYAVQDSIGTIKLGNGSLLKPGDANYAVEAVKSAVLRAGKIDSKSNQDVAGGSIYAPVVVAQGTLDDFVSKNPTNGGEGNAIHAYFNYIGANTDNFDHFRLTAPNTFAVEDMYGGGDKDFNDLVVNMNVKTA
jgi:hypothetical protein